MRTSCSTKKSRTLETPPSSHGNPSHSPDGPHQPHLLEEPEKGELKGSSLVCHPARLQSSNQTHPWKTPCCSGHAVVTPRCRQRRGGQPRYDTTTTQIICMLNNVPTCRMKRTRMQDWTSTESTLGTNDKMESQVPPPTLTCGYNPHL